MCGFLHLRYCIYTKDGTKHYLPYKKSIELFKQHNIFYAKPLFIGKMNEAFNFNIRINSTIPECFKLPPLPENLIEGVVVKPFDKCSITGERPILKIKNPEFDEDDKFHQSVNWSFSHEGSTKEMNLSFILEDMEHYISQNRFQSAVSKIGPQDKNDPQRQKDLKEECISDVITDFNENNDNIFNDLALDQQNWLKKRISSRIEKLMLQD